MKRVTLLFLFLLAAAAPATRADEVEPVPMQGAHMAGSHVSPTPVFDKEEALARSRSSLGNRIGDYRFDDQFGRPVLLHDFLGKPLLVSLIYTSCFHICPTTTRHLFEVVEKSRGLLGGDTFNVLTIGFDTAHDTPAMMAQFAVRQGVTGDGWLFLSGNPESVAGITRDLGFTFAPSPSGFDHLIQTSIVDAEGRVYRQVYGMDFQAPLIIEPLKQLLFGDSEESLVTRVSDRIRFFCTVYDPSREGYRIDYSIFIGTFIAFLCVGLLGVQLVREWRKSLRAPRQEASATHR